MQLSGPEGVGPASDIAEAVRAGAAALGHRPAITVLHPEARYEQSAASLGNWAAKGAHLLELDHLVGPGGRVGLLAPPCWTTAAVALAAWWLGAAVVLDQPGEVTVLHGDGEVDDDGRLGALDRHGIDPATALVVGDRLDGSASGELGLAGWTREAQPLPDHPPAARAGATALALALGDRSWDQRELLALAGEPQRGTVGVETGVTDPVTALVATALRPLVTGAPAVVLRGVSRQAADPERVSTWL